MQIETWSQDQEIQKNLLARAPLSRDPALGTKVGGILEAIKTRGDAAVAEFTEKFDRVTLTQFRVSEAEMRDAFEALSPALRAAFEQAKANIAAFHTAQRPKPAQIETMPGIVCEMQWRGIDTVGLYVPGGTAPLFSSVFMLAIPAELAGCKRILMCAPPQKDGKINRETLAAAWFCGLREVYAIGGAQAIAAMAYGTEQVPQVDKILGPGNAYVTMAKQLASQDPDGAAMDMPAGPSEVMVWAESGANPAWVAADLLAQAEHDPVSQAVLVTCDAELARAVQAEALRQMELLPRKEIVRQSLSISRIILAKDKDEAIEIVNAYAPEHLIMYGDKPEEAVPLIRNAGSLFLGNYSPETAGDYASGTNQVLPTYGMARAYGGLSVYQFMRSMTVQKLSREGLKGIAPTLIAMAEAEGLQAHAQAVKVRLEGGA